MMTEQKPTYLSWSPEETFQLTGRELETMINTLNSLLDTPNAREIISLYETKRILDEKVREGLQKGKVTIKVNEEAPK